MELSLTLKNMKELKFTPDPWVAQERDNWGLKMTDIVFSESLIVAKVFGNNVNEQKANAILISKAPEMYSALLKAKVALLNVTTYSELIPDSVGSGVNKAISEINKILES